MEGPCLVLLVVNNDVLSLFPLLSSYFLFFSLIASSAVASFGTVMVLSNLLVEYAVAVVRRRGTKKDETDVRSQNNRTQKEEKEEE